MRYTRFLGMVAVTLAIVLGNLHFQIVPWGLLIVPVALGVLVYLGLQVQEREVSLPTRSDARGAAISTTKAAEAVNDYLEEPPFRRPISYRAGDRRYIHEDTDLVYINGTEKKFYGIIGKEVDEEGNNKQRTIRVIWNCTDNEFWTYDSFVPGDHRTNPLFGKEQWTKNEGYRGKRRQGQRRTSGANIFVTAGDSEPEEES